MIIDLKGKVALVTGSGRGIGKAIAGAMAQSGANIIINDIDEELMRSSTEDIKAYGTKVVGIRADVSKRDEVAMMVQEASSLGHIDILVNNAGTVVRKPVEELSEEEWDRMLDVNLKGVFLCSKAIAPIMIKNKWGRIINISSIMGATAVPPRSAYCASKGGVIALTRELALEWAKYNITVNSIAPGWTLTPLTRDNFAKEEVRKYLLDMIPMKRFGEPEDMAGTAVFLASDYASYVTGQTVFVDGGWMAT